MRILVTGGGTGGHTTPAVATIQAIGTRAAEAGIAVVFRYVGSKHGVERKIAEELGIEFVGIETGKLRRSRNLIGLFSPANLADMLRVPVGYVQALGAVDRFRPDVVLSTGGYVSVPAVLAAGALKIPVVAHEQTVQVGLANKINFRVTSKIALSFEDSLPTLTSAQKSRAEVTGNPVRSIIFGGSKDAAIGQFGFDPADAELPTVYITGGAQGSRLINRAVNETLAELLGFCRIIHQCGAQPEGAEQDFDTLSASQATLPEKLRRRYAVVKFAGPEIGDVYALADLIVGRSGAGTVTEICALGKPALFIPLVPTGGDEQTRNAAKLVNAGAAEVIKQDELSGTTLLAALRQMLANRNDLSAMGRKALEFARPDAAERLAEIVMGEAPTPARSSPPLPKREGKE